MNVALFLEIKNEYTEHLIETMTPYIYEGLTCIYKEALKMAQQNNQEEVTLIIFQKLLQAIEKWNQIRIDEETYRIKQLSNTLEYFDDLVKAVIKSNIILLTYSNSISNIIGQNFYNNFVTSTFVHRCYTECAKDAHNNPYLFCHDIKLLEYKRNQIIIQEQIKNGIARAIRKILPISMILKEYLVNSVNIIQEPPKIELVGLAPNNQAPNQAQPMMPQIPNPGFPFQQTQYSNLNKKKSENKIDSNLECEVKKMIQTDNNKSDKQKIQEIINLDKILTSAKKKSEYFDHAPKSSARKELSHKKSEHEREHEEPINVIVEEENMPDNIINNPLAKSDKNTTVVNTVKKSVSPTSLSQRPLPKMFDHANHDTTERLDPDKLHKLEFIESYGPNIGGYTKSKHRNIGYH